MIQLGHDLVELCRWNASIEVIRTREPNSGCCFDCSLTALPCLRFADQSRQNVEVQIFKQSGFESFDRDRSHHRVVGAVFHCRKAKFDIFGFANRGELIAEDAVRCHSAANTKSPGHFLRRRFFDGLHGFGHKAIDDGLLKAGGKVGDFLFGQRCRVYFKTSGSSDRITNGCFESAETESDPILFQKAARKLESGRVAIECDF